ncbi:MAG: DUF4062 domain-containing protein [Verrucomicrobiaceae bacterium]|nr:DUF4062 domain-containing protein [Verrucomicrobiaceae bacterium]
MEKRYQVFVSSTYDDLKEERSCVIQALLNIDCIPCGMEYFPAANEEAWECIERLIPQCDYYVILLAGKYGSIPKGRRKSYTHLEYELALKHGVPVIGLLHRSPAKLPLDKSEAEPSRRKQLLSFREQVSRKICRFWDSAGQLPGELIPSLLSEIRRNPRTGWVRGDVIASEEAKTELIKLQRTIESQRSQLEDLKSREASNEGDLASGDDVLILPGFGMGYIGDGKERKRVDVQFEVSTTWNNLLRMIRDELAGKWKTGGLNKYILDQAKAAFPMNYGNVESHTRHLQFSDDLPSDIIEVQLTALGFASRKSSNWELTTKGLTQASRLLALKKGAVHRLSMDGLLQVSWTDVSVLDDADDFYDRW